MDLLAAGSDFTGALGASYGLALLGGDSLSFSFSAKAMNWSGDVMSKRSSREMPSSSSRLISLWRWLEE